MRVLLDENVPVELAPLFADHEVHTVVGLGWAGISNGDLLQRAARRRFEAFVTMDRSLEHQQDVSDLPFGSSAYAPRRSAWLVWRRSFRPPSPH